MKQEPKRRGAFTSRDEEIERLKKIIDNLREPKLDVIEAATCAYGYGKSGMDGLRHAVKFLPEHKRQVALESIPAWFGPR